MDELVTLRPGLPASWLALRDSLRVLVVVRDTRFRAAVDAALRAVGLDVVHCASVGALAGSITRRCGEVVLLDWSKTDGLLTAEHRAEMRQLCQATPVVLLVPERWTRLLTAEELGVARLLPKNSGLQSLLEALVGTAGVEADG